MKDFLRGEPIPPKVAADAWAEMKKTAAAPTIHPMDASIGALLGASYTVHKAHGKHKKLPSGESPFSKKLRSELAHHLDMRQERGKTDKPGFKDRLQERVIRTKLRYANMAQDKPGAAMALEGIMGAAGGTMAGMGVGGTIRDFVKGADALGLSRDVLMKKAEFLGVPAEKAMEFEVHARQLSKKAELDEEEQNFMESMRVVQDRVVGAPPAPLKRASVSPGIATLLNKKASMGELLMKREAEKEMERQAPPFEAVEQAASQLEPSDYRAPVREERRRELMGIFGGSTPKEASVKEAKIFGESTPQESYDSELHAIPMGQRARLLRRYYEKKSRESPTSLAKALGGGALIGGGAGGILGAAAMPGGLKSRLLGAGIGVAGGAGAGALIGAALRSGDKTEIGKAKARRGRSDEYLTDLAARKMVANQRARKITEELKTERRHQELMSALNKR